MARSWKESVDSTSSSKVRTISENRRAMYDLIHRFKQGMEIAIKMISGIYDLRVVFEGTKAFTHGKTIVLPNVDVFASYDAITTEDLEDAKAYFMSLRGFAWHETAHHVETDMERANVLEKEHGSFAHTIHNALDDIRIEHRFSSVGLGVAEALEFTREQWVWSSIVKDKKASGKTNLVAELILGLQIALKYNDERFNHKLWKVLEPEVTSFVERNADALDRAYDTLKMTKVPGTERLCEIVVDLLAQWKAEYDLVAPLFTKKTTSVENDTEADSKPKVELANGVSPFLLVTTAPKASSLNTVKFGSGYVRRVEEMPRSDDWSSLQPLAKDEQRTLVIHPPDPEEERALDEAMAALFGELVKMGQQMEAEAKEALSKAKVEIEKLPADQRPYLVYTTENDKFLTTAETNGTELQQFKEVVDAFVGPIKRQLTVLLRCKTRRRWKSNFEEGEQIDDDALVDIVMSKHDPNARLRPFRDRVVESTLNETAVGLLTDVSGSMQSGGGYGYGYGGGGRGYESKLKLAQYATLCFGESLSQASIDFASWAFSSDENYWSQVYSRATSDDRQLYGRFGALHIETVKGFDERWGVCAARVPRIGEHSHANYDGDSVQWAAQRLLARKAKRRVLFVMSDGQPATGEPSTQQARQQRHLKDVVKAMIARNIEVVGIGICDQAVKDYYPRAVVVDKASDLPSVVMNEMKFLLLNSR